MFVLVTSVVLYSVYRFRMKPGEEDMDGPPIHGNTRLEVIWTALPAIMMLGLCVYAAIELHNAEKAPAAGPPELNVRVVGEQFAWTFYYTGTKDADGKEVASNQLYLPKDRSVRFTVQTKDVLHDFWVPAFRWKIDAVPGITTQYRVTPNRIGSYPVVCAELCGLGHAVMRQTAHVLSEEDFQAWLDKKGQPGGETAAGGGGGGGGGAAPASADGEALFASNGCGGCHTLTAAGSSATIGPNLDTALKGQDAAMVRQDIVEPNAEITKGYGANIMPENFGESLSPEEIDALVKYLQENQKG
jgi:cytochrome c oxidase subunit 2